VLVSVGTLLEERARRWGRRPFLIDASTGRDRSFADVQDQALDLDAALRGRTSPIGLAIDSPGAYAAAYVALLSLGHTVVPLAPAAPDAETARTLDAAGAAGWLTGADDSVGLRWAASNGRVAAPGGGVVMFTSGTTGSPKGVRLGVDQLLHNARAVVAAHDFRESDIGLCPLPLWHINAQVVGVLAALCAGSTLVLDAGFHRSRFWRTAREYGVSWINAAPAIIHILGVADDGVADDGVADDGAAADAPPPGLRFVRSASAPLAPVDRERFERRFAVPIVESYGMTEAAGMITVNTPAAEGHAVKAGSAGRASGVCLRIVDGGGARVASGTVGSVEITGPSVINSYLDGERGGRFSADGWLVTGDLGRLDEAGDLFLAGRSDDVINRGGELVHPREVEDVVLEHRQVDAIAVVGLPDAKLGERVVALVVRNDTDASRPDDAVADDLATLASRHLSAFKRPSEYRFVAELPRGSTGKIRRRAARSMIEAMSARCPAVVP
jgi:acyl-CoA synthetase (AMP-forming)/AMP-acid ligase II